MKIQSSYQAKEIKVLEGLEPVRKRPGMYIGSTDSKGLHHLAKEILDNAVDEAIAGYGKNIKLFRQHLTDEQKKLASPNIIGQESLTVVDNGRGIPVDMHESGVSALEVVMTKLHAGGKFEETAYQASGGLHGVGSSAVNALSAWMQVVVKRDQKYFYQAYTQGKPQAKVAEIPATEVTKLFPLESPELIGYQSGTIVQFVPDTSIFTANTKFSHQALVQIIKDRAYLMAGLYFEFIDQIQGITQHYYFEGGIKSLVEHLNLEKKALHQVFHVNTFYEDEESHKKIGVEVALQYNDSYAERLESYVNVIHTPDGGAHVNGFRLALSNVLRAYAQKNNLLKEKEVFISEDLKEGLTAVIFVKMPANDLQFESQTKARLNNSEAQTAVYNVFKNGFEIYLEEHPKVGKAIIEKIMLSARARMAARAAKDAVIRKGIFEGSSLPGKLADCQSRVAEESEIYIVEGDSAGGCFAGETKIALADGRSLNFHQIIKEQAKKIKHYCYTIRKNGRIGIEQILNPRKTKSNVPVIQISLDNKQKIICTPDHLFMLRDGSYKKAIQLNENDSLMPLYRKFSDINQSNITINNYEMSWDPGSNQWIFTHLLADWYNQWQKKYSKKAGDHCHHLDFNKHNNNPNNIQRLPSEEHLKLHQEQISKTLHQPAVIKKCATIRQTKEYRQKLSQRMLEPTMKKMLSHRAKKQWQNNDYKAYMLKQWKKFYQTNITYQKENLKRLSEAQKKYWASDENRHKRSQLVSEYFNQHPDQRFKLSILSKQQWQNQDLINWRRQKTKEQWTNEFRAKRLQKLNKTYFNKTLAALKLFKIKPNKLNLTAYREYRVIKGDRTLLRFDTFCQKYFNGNRNRAYDLVLNHNHRVTAIKMLKKRIDVYDLEIPFTHNFALASGIFVHNSAKQGRDRKFQAIFPLRGKILNTERSRLDKVVAFEELKNLVIALGAGIGETFNIEKLRYHRIILMNDADVDGEHITTLGLTFFFRHLPQIVEQGYLYIAMPPLYRISAEKQSYYVYSDEERDKLIKELRQSHPDIKISSQRYKGLGEMNPEQLWETTMNPKTRTIKKVNIDDAQKADHTFEVLMGDDVPPRKKFIQTHAKMAELDI